MAHGTGAATATRKPRGFLWLFAKTLLFVDRFSASRPSTWSTFGVSRSAFPRTSGATIKVPLPIASRKGHSALQVKDRSPALVSLPRARTTPAAAQAREVAQACESTSGGASSGQPPEPSGSGARARLPGTRARARSARRMRRARPRSRSKKYAVRAAVAAMTAAEAHHRTPRRVNRGSDLVEKRQLIGPEPLPPPLSRPPGRCRASRPCRPACRHRGPVDGGSRSRASWSPPSSCPRQWRP